LFIVAFWKLGSASFWDPDEAHYAQTTREMMATGDWTAPYYNERPFFDKPIFFHWLQALPMLTFGDPEFGARLVPAAAAAILVLITLWLGRRISDSTTGVLAALMLAASPGVFTLSRYAILDSLFAVCLFGGVALIAIAALKGPRSLQYAGYVCIGFATFTKGPVALALCGVAFAFAILMSADVRRRLLALRWIVGLAIAVVIPAPWFGYMVQRFDGAFIDGYVLNENVLLFATAMYSNQPPWWFYLSIIAVGMLPWTPLLVGRLVDQLRRAAARKPIDPFEVLLWSWVAAIVVLFSVSRFRLDHYVFPAAPALCLICARAWRDVRHGVDAPASRLGVRLIGPTLIVAGLVAGALLIGRLNLPPIALAVAAALVVAGAVAARGYTPAALRDARFPAAALGALAVVYVGLLLWVIPTIEGGKVMPEVAGWVAAHASPDDRVATFRLNRWNTAFRFYVNRHTLLVESDDESRRFFEDPSPYYLVTTRELYELLRSAGVPLKVVYSQRGLWVTSGRALWRRPAERTEFVVTAPAGREL
jgi:4-amino-4-deoxy-L-arabinose transferase-like glycosyltransferase